MHVTHHEHARTGQHRMPPGWVWAVAAVAVVAAIGVGVTLAMGVLASRSGGSAHPAPVPSTTPSAGTPAPAQPCPASGTKVSTAGELKNALRSAQPGDVILLAPGRYEGKFVAKASGTADSPITLCGTAEAVLDGGSVTGGYVFHLDGATHWALQGFTVRNGQKGVMADGTTGTVIRGLTVTGIGDEGIHLRAGSTANQVLDNTVSRTGLRKPKFGEGIYIGTAQSNWCDVSDCKPDASDRNLVQGNRISATTAESVDIKEGTTAGILRDNTFDGSGFVDADSWVDVKGNDWLIEGNTGTASPADGFQTHQILDGWGTGNVFLGNSAQLDGKGVAFAMKSKGDNLVHCDNTVTGSGAELSNVECRD
ncbi:hypothetical protein AAIB33_13160 [Microbacterium sp. AZCO]|uniref:right-handed parallel beta-helix repeat-containing protein n=1 Tax=Microbacterium sp. AZCO TaxID=3142976 RepID=UPI0031F3CE44